jgi:hypothetical protein
MSDQDSPGYGRDADLEQARGAGRPAGADLDAAETSPPHIDYAPDPDSGRADDVPTAPDDPEGDGAPPPDETLGDDVPKIG